MKYSKIFCGEIYVLIRALVEKKVKTDYELLQKNESVWLPMLGFFEDEMKNNFVNYKMCNKNFIELYFNDNFICKVETIKIAEIAKNFYGAVIDTERFDAKSKFKNPPTLFNASKSTNFKFEIPKIRDEEILQINKINTKTKIIDRMRRISELRFISVTNETFSKNLMFIDTQMEKFLAEMLKIYYKENISECAELVTLLDERDPLNFKVKNLYRHKLKKFLCAVALGFMPSKKWNGLEEANGGYIIVKESGEVLAYHLHDRDSFENYLLNNTKLEKGSIRKHDFGKIYRERAVKAPCFSYGDETSQIAIAKIKNIFYN